jgi:hypothetical protein
MHFVLTRASVLHPRHKLQYFKTAGWQDEWIQTAEGLVRDEFERSYASSKNDHNSNLDLADEVGIRGNESDGKKVSIVHILTVSNPIR